jgi:major intracellular serine protease
MAQLKVIANKLNMRTSPVTDFADKGNIVSVVTKGVVIESVAQIENNLGIWCQNSDGHWASEKWLSTTLEIPKWMDLLQLPTIWDVEKGGKACVAVLDTGYNTSNNEIKGNVFDQHISIQNPTVKIDINDNNGHGTLCASLIASQNRNFIVGCAPEAQLYIAKISDQQELRFKFLIDGIKWAIQKKVDIISISYGAQKDDEDLHNAIKEAVIENNILIIAAIGNNDPERGQSGGDFPALYPECLAVGAIDNTNHLSLVTKRNPKTEINAPGEGIIAYLKGSAPEATPNGTSQATAIIAGICALIISRHKVLNKSYTVKSIKDLIAENFEPVEGVDGQKLISPSKIFSKI